MFKQLIAGVTAVSLTLASPAQAGNLDRDDVGKLLFGIAAIAALNSIIENNERRSTARAAAPKQQSTQVHDRSWERRHAPTDHGQRWSNLSGRSNARIVPFACLRRVETRFGNPRIFTKRCLDRNYRHAANLPRRCAVRLYSNNGPVSGFDPACLRQQGYRSDRRN